jgi:hypothetical protein
MRTNSRGPHVINYPTLHNHCSQKAAECIASQNGWLILTSEAVTIPDQSTSDHAKQSPTLRGPPQDKCVPIADVQTRHGYVPIVATHTYLALGYY